MHIIMDESTIDRTLSRITHEIIEQRENLDNVLLIGIRSRGYPLAKRIQAKLKQFTGKDIYVDSIEINFYKDNPEKPIRMDPAVLESRIHSVNDKDIIIFDDVLFSGRTILTAVDAIFELGHPNTIQLAVLIDRGHRKLPIRPDYIGKNVPTNYNERIDVKLKEIDGEDKVIISE